MKNILLKFFLVFAVFFQIELVAEEKNYHKELITDWSRIFPDKNRNAAGPKFFKYIIDKKITCLLYTSPSPRDLSTSRMPASA